MGSVFVVIHVSVVEMFLMLHKLTNVGTFLGATSALYVVFFDFVEFLYLPSVCLLILV